MLEKPLVSVCSITYNHAPFIRQCIEGMLMQETDFPFEIIINDDCSTDGTTDIIQEYAAKYPEKIIPIFHEKNMYSCGVLNPSKNYIFPKIKGKYAALCEGDDYWTDPHKLQKQVDFLEAHPDYSISYHKVQIVNTDGSQTIGYYPDWLKDKEATFELKDMERRNIIQTNSVLYRWRFHTERLDDYFWEGIMPGDWMYHLLHAAQGKVHYSPEVMSAYRHHSGGIWSSMVGSDELYLRYGYAHALFFKNAREVVPLGFDVLLGKLLREELRVFLEHNRLDLLAKVRDLFPEEMDEIIHNIVGGADKRSRFGRSYVQLIAKSYAIYRLSRLIANVYQALVKKKHP